MEVGIVPPLWNCFCKLIARFRSDSPQVHRRSGRCDKVGKKTWICEDDPVLKLATENEMKHTGSSLEICNSSSIYHDPTSPARPKSWRFAFARMRDARNDTRSKSVPANSSMGFPCLSMTPRHPGPLPGVPCRRCMYSGTNRILFSRTMSDSSP